MFLDSIGMTNTRVLAKLETRQALLNIRGILASADGIIVSRCGLHPKACHRTNADDAFHHQRQLNARVSCMISLVGVCLVIVPCSKK